MTARRKAKMTFEEGMEALSQLVAAMDEGKMSLEESMAAYEQGMALSAQLGQMLDSYRKKIEMIDPQTAEIKAFEENEHGV